MHKNRMTIVAVTAAVMLFTAATFANAQTSIPHRFKAALDGDLVTKISPIDGRTWSAWTYRQGAQTDIAVSYRNSDGIWFEPTLIGARDGIEQVQPAIAIDHNGNVYLAWAEPNTGRVLVSALGYGAERWSTPKVVNDVRVRGASPSLMIAAQRRLVVGFIASGRVRLVELRLLPKRVQTQASDGPDPVGQTAEDNNEGLLDGPGNDHDSFGDHSGAGEIKNTGEVRKVTGKN